MSDIETSIHKGDYAFQEYATLNWIQHAENSSDLNQIAANLDSTSLRDKVAILYQRDLEQFATGSLDSVTQDLRSNMRSILNKCHKVYDLQDSISSKEVDSGKAWVLLVLEYS